MKVEDLLVGKSALLPLNQSQRLVPLAAQTRCTLSRYHLTLLDIAMEIGNGPRKRESGGKEL